MNDTNAVSFHYKYLRPTFLQVLTALLWVAVSAVCSSGQAQSVQTSNREIGLRPVDPQQFLVEPDTVVTLRWTWDGPTPGKPWVCQISGYDGTMVRELNASQKEATISLSVSLPAGYYAITFPDQNQVFGLVVQPNFQGERDHFFGLDASLSWLGPQALRPSFVGILRKMGVSIARERLNWPEIQPTLDSWNWESPKHYDSMRKLYSTAKIPILEVFHAAPDWMQSDKDKSAFPENLPVTEKSWEQIAHRWSGNWGGIEVWNEPDIIAGRGGPQAERYVPLVKTIRYALRAANAETPVGGGVFGYFTRSYMDLAAENGLLQTVDFLSFHYYKDPFVLQGFISEYRNYLKQFNRESLPLWITESGENWKGPSHIRPDLAQDRSSALQYVELAVEARACGVARIFPFVLPDYSEYGTNNFGLLDAAGTPVRSLASYAKAIQALSHAKYVGDMEFGDQAVRARVFKDTNGRAVIVVEAAAPDKYSVTVPFAVNGIEGIDGRRLEAKEGHIGLTDGLAYVHADFASIQGRLKTETAAMSLQRSASLPLPPPVAAPAVLEASLDSKTYPYGVRGYELSQNVVTLPVKVRVDNLSNKSQDLVLVFNGDSVATKQSQVSVPPSSFREIVQDIEVSSIHFDAGGIGRIRVEAKGKDGETILPSVFYVSNPLGLDAYLKANPYHFALPIGDLGRWDKNSSGEMTYSHSDAGNLQYSIAFKEKDHWAYPRFALPQEVDLDRITGVLVRGRCDHPATVRIMTWAGKNNNYNVTGYSIFPADGQWHVAYVPFSDFVPPGESGKVGQQIKTISVGFGASQGDSNRVEISDVILLGK